MDARRAAKTADDALAPMAPTRLAGARSLVAAPPAADGDTKRVGEKVDEFDGRRDDAERGLVLDCEPLSVSLPPPLFGEDWARLSVSLRLADTGCDSGDCSCT
jgi:hypothetical protein